HAHPARAVLVELTLAVPVELDLDASVLVDVDLLAARPHDDRRLNARDLRLRDAPARSIGRLDRHALESVEVGIGRAGVGEGGGEGLARVLDPRDEVLAIEPDGRVARQLEAAPGSHADHAADPGADPLVVRVRLEAQRRLRGAILALVAAYALAVGEERPPAAAPVPVAPAGAPAGPRGRRRGPPRLPRAILALVGAFALVVGEGRQGGAAPVLVALAVAPVGALAQPLARDLHRAAARPVPVACDDARHDRLLAVHEARD